MQEFDETERPERDELTSVRLALRELIEAGPIWRDADRPDSCQTDWHDDGRMMAAWSHASP